MNRTVRRLLPAAVLAVLLAGAAGYVALFAPHRATEPVEQAEQSGQPEEGSAFHVGDIVVAEPFAFATAPEAPTASGYMRIENTGSSDDRLVAATADVAGQVEIQATSTKGGMSIVDALSDGLAVPAGSVVQLRPGAWRLSLQELKRPLREGESFSGTLTFEKAGTIPITYAVAPNVAPIGGPFTLVDEEGKAFSESDLRGRPYAIFFGYTHCPDVCPTTLYEMSQALAALGDDADRLRVVFVSVDPARDTPPFLKNYLSAFDPRIVGLTGTEETVAVAAKAFRIFHQKNPGEDGDYSMDHSATVLLMDANGGFVGTISYGEESASRVAKLKRLIGGSSRS